MSKKSVFTDRWSYLKPDTEPNSEGRIALIKKASFGPLETYNWGIDENGLPYEEYTWCENDLFEHLNYIKNITKAELTKKIEELIREFTEEKRTELAAMYKRILERVNKELS